MARSAHLEYVWENIVDIDGNPWNWNGYSAEMTLHIAIGTITPFLSFTNEENLGPSAGSSIVLHTGINNNTDPSTIMIDRIMDELILKPYPRLQYALWITNEIGISRPWFVGELKLLSTPQRKYVNE